MRRGGVGRGSGRGGLVLRTRDRATRHALSPAAGFTALCLGPTQYFGPERLADQAGADGWAVNEIANQENKPVPAAGHQTNPIQEKSEF